MSRHSASEPSTHVPLRHGPHVLPGETSHPGDGGKSFSGRVDVPELVSIAPVAVVVVTKSMLVGTYVSVTGAPDVPVPVPNVELDVVTAPAPVVDVLPDGAKHAPVRSSSGTNFIMS